MLPDDIKREYDRLFSLFISLYFSLTLLALAEFYNHRGFPSLTIEDLSSLEKFSFVLGLLELGTFLFVIYIKKGFWKFFKEKYKSNYKRSLQYLASVFFVVGLVVRIIIPSNIVLFVQNFLLLAAIIYLIYGLCLFIFRSKQKT